MTKNELEQLIGILIIMSIVKMLSPRAYWAAETRHTKIADTVSRNRFIIIIIYYFIYFTISKKHNTIVTIIIV